MLLDERYISQDSVQLRDYYAAPHPGVLHKQIDHPNDYARRLIALSPLVVLGTQGPRGLDCSPKGGELGFIQVENDKTLLLPDHGGNNHLDSLTNLLHYLFAGLLFLIPGWSECFRVNGPGADFRGLGAPRAICPERGGGEERADHPGR